jgi:hypothetical protein
VFDDEVGPMLTNDGTAVSHRQGWLTLESEPENRHLDGHGCLVGMLSEAWAESFVNRDGRPEDLVCDRVVE